jgi:integrase
MKKFSFTKQSLDALPTSARKKYNDAKVGGLGILVHVGGRKSFFWQRKVNGRPRWETIGAYPDLSIEQARGRASELNMTLAKWKASGFHGPNPFEVHSGVTLAGIFELYVDQHLKQHALRPERAEKHDRLMFNTHLSGWRDRKLGQLRREDVAELHRNIPKAVSRRTKGRDTGKPAANAVVHLIKRLYFFADKTGNWIGSNPTTGIKMFDETPRTRYAQPEELSRIWRGLPQMKNPDLRDFINLALWTGARKSDVLSMRWTDVQMGDNRWDIPDPKNRKPYPIPLTVEAIKILKGRHKLRVQNSPWVFPATRKNKSGHIQDLKKSWATLLKKIGLNGCNLRIHDLRRTQGSYQAAQGTSLLLIGRSLGHKSLSATQIYSQVNLDPVRDSMERANATMHALMKAPVREIELRSPAGD